MIPSRQKRDGSDPVQDLVQINSRSILLAILKLGAASTCSVSSRMESLFLALILAFSVHSAYGIYCFQCNSHMDPECATIEPNDTSSRFYRLCEPTEASAGKELFCRKTVQKIMDRENIQRVIRSCGWVIHPKQDCYWIWNKGHEDISCQCFSDACNSAPVNTPWISVLIGLGATLYFLLKG